MNQVNAQKPSPPTRQAPAQRRSEATRERILRTAERLFAQQGVTGVSLNTINKMARQKNKNAVHYHFGGKAGLIQAIYDKHAPVIAARRRDLLQDIDATGQTGLRPLIQALVVPVAEQASHDGGEYYIHISAELIATNTLSYYGSTDQALRINREMELSERIQQELGLPHLIIEARMLLVTGLLFHGLSDHLRIRDRAEAPSSLTSMPLFVSNLIDSICALLQTPPSAETQTLLGTDTD